MVSNNKSIFSLMLCCCDGTDFPRYFHRALTCLFVFPECEYSVIDVQDFTGQGDLKFYEADIDEEDGKSFFINEDERLEIVLV